MKGNAFRFRPNMFSPLSCPGSYEYTFMPCLNIYCRVICIRCSTVLSNEYISSTYERNLYAFTGVGMTKRCCRSVKTCRFLLNGLLPFMNRDLSRFMPYPDISSGNAEHLHCLVTKMVDRLHGDAAGFWFIKGTGDVAVEGGPGLLIDPGLRTEMRP